MLQFIIWCRLISKYLLVGWLLTILIVSSIPNIPTLKIHTARSEIRLDYLMHFCEYGVLTFMAFLTFSGNEFRVGFRKIIVIAAGLMLFAVLDETHQKLIPGRTFNYRDILSNLAGIFAFTIFTLIVLWRIGIRLKQK